MKGRFLKILLAVSLGAPTVAPLFPTVVLAEEAAAESYKHEDAVTVSSGTGAIELSEEDTAKFSAAESLTYSVTFTKTGSSVNSLFFIGDTSKTHHYMTLYLNNNTLGYEAQTASNTFAYRSSVNLDGMDLSQEHRLSLVISAKDSVRIYVDGQKVLEESLDVNAVKDVLTGVNYVGFGKGVRSNNSNAYPLTGTLSNIELYASALSEQEILDYQLGGLNSTVFDSGDPVYQTNAAMKRVDVPEAVASMSEGSISVRFKTNVTSGFVYLTAVSDQNQNDMLEALYLQKNGNVNRIGLDCNGTSPRTMGVHYVDLGAIDLFDGSWHTVTAARKDKATTFYVDGENCGTATSTGAGLFNLIDGPNSIGLGFCPRTSANKNPLNGSIDSVQIHSAVLNDAEVKMLHARTKLSDKQTADLTNAELEGFDPLYYSGYDNCAYYRIPSLLTTKDGTVLAGIDRRHEGYPDYGNIDMGIRRKEAGQSEFGAPIVVTDLVRNDHTGRSAFLIDSSLVQDTDPNSPHFGRIYMLMDMFPESLGIIGNYGATALSTGSGYITIDGESYLLLKNADDEEFAMKEVNGTGEVWRLDEVEATIDPEEGEEGGTEGSDSDSDPETETVKVLGEKTGYKVVIDCPAPYHERGSIYKDGQYKGNIYLNGEGEGQGELFCTRTSYLWLSYSDDDGKSWSNPKDLNPMVKDSWMLFEGAGPGRGLQLENGNLLFPVYTTNSNVGASQSSALIYSEDYGETWKLGDSPQTLRGIDVSTMSSGTMLTESQAVQLKNGKVLLFMRNTSGNVCIAQSSDGGKTWDERMIWNESALRDVYCQLSVISYTGKDGNEYILISNPRGSNIEQASRERSHGYVQRGLVKEDGTIEWKEKQLIFDGDYGYSCLTEIEPAEDGTKRFGLIFEDGGNLRYGTFDENYLMAPSISVSDKAPVYAGSTAEKSEDEAGTTVSGTITFDQPLFAAGTPRLLVSMGETEYEADILDGNGSSTISYTLSLPAGAKGVLRLKGIKTDAGLLENVKGITPAFEQEMLMDLSQITDGLSIHEYTSQHSSSTAENTDGAAVNILDGNPNTYWHSTYNNSDITLPQSVTVKLDSPKSINRIDYLPRQNNSNVTCKDYTIFVSSDGEHYEIAKEGTLQHVANWQSIRFPAKDDVQYVRFQINSTFVVADSCAMAEMAIFEAVQDAQEQGDPAALQATVTELAELDETKYSTASWTPLARAMAEASAILEGDYQAAADLEDCLLALNAARQNLVDITRLEPVAQEAAKVEDTGYSPATWNAFSSAREQLNARANQAMESREVRDLMEELSYLQTALRADTSALEAAMEEAAGWSEANTIPETWNALKEAKAKGQNILDADNPGTDAVKEALADLQAALKQAVHKGDKTDLQTKLTEAESWSEANTTPNTWSAVKEAKAEAQSVLANESATQEMVDQVLAKLSTALQNAHHKADKFALIETLNELKALKEVNFEAESWNTLNEAIGKAETLAANENALQQEVDDMVSELEAARNGLKREPLLDLLELAIAKADKIGDGYQTGGIPAMEKARTDAKAVLASPETKEQLAKAVKALHGPLLDMRYEVSEERLAKLK